MGKSLAHGAGFEFLASEVKRLNHENGVIASKLATALKELETITEQRNELQEQKDKHDVQYPLCGMPVEEQRKLAEDYRYVIIPAVCSRDRDGGRTDQVCQVHHVVHDEE